MLFVFLTYTLNSTILVVKVFNLQVTIGAIVPGGAAEKEGTLKSGDRLLTVDGKRVTRLGHNEVYILI